MQSNSSRPISRGTGRATATARAAILRILIREGAVTLAELEQELPHGKSTMYKAIDRLRVSGAVGIRSGKIDADSRRTKILYLKDTSPRLVLCVSERHMTAYWMRAKGDGAEEDAVASETTPLPLTYTCTPGMTLLENAYVFLSRVADEQLKPYTDREGRMIYPPVLVWDREEDGARRLRELADEVLGARGMTLEDGAGTLTVSSKYACLIGLSCLPGTAHATSALILQTEWSGATGWIAARETPAHAWFITSLGHRIGSCYTEKSRTENLGGGCYAAVAAYLHGIGKWISPDVVVLDTAWHEPSADEMNEIRRALPSSYSLHVLADTQRLVAYGASRIAHLAYYGVV